MPDSLSDSSTWRLSTDNGIPFRLISRSGTFTEEEATAQEVYIIKGDKLVDFVNESFPAPQLFLGGLFYPTRRRMPGVPVFKTARLTWEQFTEGLPIDPFGSDANAPDGTYKEEVKLTIDYSTSFENDAAPDPNNPFTFLEIEANAGGGFWTTPSRGKSKWEGVDVNGTQEPDLEIREKDIPITLSAPEVEWNIRWSQIPFGFFSGTMAAVLRQKLGKVNSTPMTLMFDAPAETVLFMGWTLRQQFTWRSGSSGQPPLQLDLKFHEKNFLGSDGVQVTHNHIFRPTGTPAGTGFSTLNPTYAGWRRVLIETANGYEHLYESTNLNSIFTP